MTDQMLPVKELALYKLLINGSDGEDHLAFIGHTQAGEALTQEQMPRLSNLDSQVDQCLFTIKWVLIF